MMVIKAIRRIFDSPSFFRLIIILSAAFSSVAFVIDFSVSENGIYTYRLYESMKGKGPASTLLFIGFYLLYKFVFSDKKLSPLKGEHGLALFIAAFFVMGNSFYTANSLWPIVSSPVQIIKSIICFCGSYFAYLALIRAAYYLLDKYSQPWNCRFKIITKNPALFWFALIFILWLPHIIIKYPGAMCYDNYSELSQYYGYDIFMSEHPPFHTFLLGIFFDLGLLFGSANLGLFMAVLCQTTMLAAVVGVTLAKMRELEAPRWLILVSAFTYAFSPYLSGFIGTPIKDVPYSALYLLLVVITIDYAKDEEGFFRSPKKIVSLVLTGALIMLIRNNGILAVLPLSIYIFIRQIKINRKKLSVIVTGTASLIAIFVITFTVNGALKICYNIQDGSISESLSFCFQQTARYVRDHSDDITPDEREAIDKILDYDSIGEKYDPRISDEVKETYKESATTKDLMNYFGVWIKQFFKHPITYFEATLNQNYSLFYPQADNIMYYRDIHTVNEFEGNMEETNGLSHPEWLDNLRGELFGYYHFLHTVPVLGLLANVGFYVLLLLILLLFIRNKKLHGMAPLLILMLSTLIMAVFAPVIMRNARYVFPLVYSMPVMLAYYIYTCRKGSNILINSERV